MTRKLKSELPASPGPDAEPDPFDISMSDVPADWVEAQKSSPGGIGHDSVSRRSARFNVIPTGRTSPYIANVAAVAAAFVSGCVWYLADVLDLYRGPWIAVVVGAVIAAAVRLAGGEQFYRAALSATMYMLTLIIVLAVLTHRELTDIYGKIDDLQDYEQSLVRTRLRDTTHLAAYCLGGVVAAQIGYWQRRVRRARS